MAAVQPLPNSAFVKVEVDFTSNWNTASPAFTDVTTDIRLGSGLSWERGRNDEYQTVSPGTCSFTLNNRTRTYDPTTNANMVPARPVRVTCYYPTTGTAYQQGDFLAEDWTPAWTVDGDAVVQADCVERWGGLGFARIVSTAYLATTDAAVREGQLADSAGWPTAARSFQSGLYALNSETYQSTDVLSAMQDVANSQNHILYQDRNGTLTTRGRFAGAGSNVGTFGDTPAELDYAGIADGVGGGYWYTQVQVTSTGPAWINGQPNTVSKNVGGIYTIAKFGTRVLALEISAVTQSNAQNVCNAIAAQLATQSAYRIKSAVIRPLSDPTNLFPVVLNADLGNPVTFNLTPPGGGGRISQTGKIRSIRHEITDRDWLVTWNLSP